MNENEDDIQMERKTSEDDGQSEQLQPSDVQLPVNYALVGSAEPDDLQVYVRQEVFRRIEDYSSSDKSKELGGILLGDYTEQMSKRFLIVSEFIEAKYTDASASTLTFTHESWEYIYEQQQTLYPSLRIVGWQHTHPGYEIFLSNYDLFIQKNFFNLPEQVAYVVDPINGTRGFFQWKKGEIEKLSGFYLYGEANEKIELPSERKKRAPSKGWTLVLRIVTGGLIILLAGGLAWSMLLNIRMKQTIEGLLGKYAQAVQINETLKNKCKELDTQSVDLKRAILNLVTERNAAQAAAKAVCALPTPAPSSTQPSKDPIRYTVKSGDTICSICRKLGIDLRSHYKEIKDLNGLRDLNKIRTGQVLLLPAGE